MCLTRKKTVQLFSISQLDINIALGVKKKQEPREIVPAEYDDRLSLFSEEGSNILLPHRKYDHQINLKEGKESLFSPLYGMGREELLMMKSTLQNT